MTEHRILLSQATVDKQEEEALLRAVRSGWVAPLGPEVDAFEEEIAQRTGCEHGLALSSGTAALHLALLRLGVGEGDYVPVSSLTFAATTNAIEYVGATPVFVDALEDGNIDPKLLDQAISELKAEGKSVPVLITVDLMGRCCEYPEIEEIAKQHDVTLLVDAAESLGASINGRPAGSFGVAAAISFNGNKIITTSGGGMLVSNDKELIDGARYLSTQARQPVAWYEHTDIGYNYRLSNLLAAVGRAQLAKLDTFMARRAEIRARYQELGERLGFRLLGDVSTPHEHKENCWLSTIVLDDDHALTPDDLIAALGEANIEARHLWKPMHLQPVYAGARGVLNGTAEKLFGRAVTLPSGSGLSDADIDRVVETLNRTLHSDC